MKRINNNKGSYIISFIIVIAVVAIMLTFYIPNIQNALKNRAIFTKDYIKSTDTRVD